MRQIVIPVILLCSAIEAIGMTETQDYHLTPLIDKCCPDDEVLDTQTRKCATLEYQTNAILDPIFVPLSSDYLNLTQDSDSDISLIGNVFFPQCDIKTETLRYILSPENNASKSSFLIDDSGEPYALTDLTDENFTSYTSYCLERGYNDSQIIGTVALVCRTREVMICQDPRSQIPMDDDIKDQGQENNTLIEFLPECLDVIDYEHFALDSKKGSATAGGTEYSFGDFCLWVNATKITVCPPDDSKGFLLWHKNVNLTMMPILFAISLIFLCILFVHTNLKNGYV